MPKAKWMSSGDFAAYERCLKHLKNKKGINKYAVCASSIKKGKKHANEAMRRVGKKK